MDSNDHPEPMLSSEDLREIDIRILNKLRAGRVTPTYVRKEIKSKSEDDSSYSRGYIQQRLSRLVEHGHARNLNGTGLYELIDDPRR
jgi:hypothetical protein